MARRNTIVLPDKTTITPRAGPWPERNAFIKEVILNTWSGYCIDGWFIPGRTESAVEQNVKRLLSDCGTYLLFWGERSKRLGIISKPRETHQKMVEVPYGLKPIPELLDCLVDNQEVQPKKAREKQKGRRSKAGTTETSFGRCMKLREMYPVESFDRVLCTVDTDGCFELNGVLYQISDSDAKYAGVRTKEGSFYGQDKIWVIRKHVPILSKQPGEVVAWLDEQLFSIPYEDVRKQDVSGEM